MESLALGDLEVESPHRLTPNTEKAFASTDAETRLESDSEISTHTYTTVALEGWLSGLEYRLLLQGT